MKKLKFFWILPIIAIMLFIGCKEPDDGGPVIPPGPTTAELVETFKADHAEVLALVASTVQFSHWDAINAAIADYEELTAAAKEQLTDEKTLLDNLRNRVLPASNYRAKHAVVFALTAETVDETNEEAVDAAIEDYDNLVTATQGLLPDDKAFLVGLKETIFHNAVGALKMILLDFGTPSTDATPADDNFITLTKGYWTGDKSFTGGRNNIAASYLNNMLLFITDKPVNRPYTFHVKFSLTNVFTNNGTQLTSGWGNSGAYMMEFYNLPETFANNTYRSVMGFRVSGLGGIVPWWHTSPTSGTASQNSLTTALGSGFGGAGDGSQFALPSQVAGTWSSVEREYEISWNGTDTYFLSVKDAVENASGEDTFYAIINAPQILNEHFSLRDGDFRLGMSPFVADTQYLTVTVHLTEISIGPYMP